MAAIILRIGKKTIETDAEDVGIGTSASCIAAINDPVAAALHAWIRRRAGLFLIEDAGSASGTWKNGQPVTKAVPLADGDEVVVGCTKIDVKIAPDAAVPQLDLTFREKTFYFEPSKKHQVMVDGQEKSVVSGDAERWVRDEVAFGRFRLLKVLSAMALLVAVALLVLASSRTAGGRFLQPGELHAQHAMLFEHGGNPSFVAASAIAQAQGCNACHDTFGGAPSSKCAACHADMMRERHPFPSDRSSTAIAKDVVMGEGACSTCHVDHQGANASFIPASEAVASSCATCHPAGAPRAEARRPVALPEQNVRIAYDAFSHAQHAGAACDACHTKTATTEQGRDFAHVGFLACMGCHATDDAGAKFPRDPVLASRAPPVAKEHEVDLAWHGTLDGDARCLACHSAAFQAELRQVQTRDVDHLTLQARRRGHTELFAGHVAVADASGKTRACADCHLEGKPVRADEPYTGRFRHAQHLATVFPSGADAARTLSLECATCHGEQKAAQHLIGRAGPASDDVTAAPAYLGPDLQACAACHKDQHGVALITRVDEPTDGRPAQRNDFPHALHMSTAPESLRQGCFSCHSFEGADDESAPRAVTKPEAASCMPCHQTHANVGGNGCQLCHPDAKSGQGGFTLRGKADIAFLSPSAQDERAFKQRAATPGFSHDTRGHQGGCTSCHADADKAATIRDVKMPSESDAVCWKCHVEDAQQFHWRGAPAPR